MALTVESVSPAANSQGCPLGQVISVRFNQTVDQNTVDLASFVLTQTTLVGLDQLLTKDQISATTVVEGALSFAVADGKTTVTFSPRSPLSPNAKFQVLLSTQIKSLTGEGLNSIYKWSFETGAGSVVTPASDHSDVAEVPYRSSPVTPLSIAYDPYLKPISAMPAQAASNLPLSTKSFTITFNKALDASKFSSSSFQLVAEAVDGDPGRPAAGTLSATAQIVNNTQLSFTINLTRSPLYKNNIVILTIPTLLAADGGRLEEPLEYYFTTAYDPLYSTVRLVRSRIGSFIQEIPDDTINLAIFDASTMADSFIPTLPENMTAAWSAWLAFSKSEYTRATACLTLLQNSPTIGFRQKSKLLGDMQVTWQQSTIIEKMVAALAKEAEYWQNELHNGGVAPQKVQTAIKGACDWDRPWIGRDFSSYPGDPPAANTAIIPPFSRRALKVWQPRVAPGWRRGGW